MNALGAIVLPVARRTRSALIAIDMPVEFDVVDGVAAGEGIAVLRERVRLERLVTEPLLVVVFLGGSGRFRAGRREPSCRRS